MKFKRICIIACSFLLLYGGQIFAQLNISAKNTEIKTVLKQIESKSDYTFFYSDNFLDLNKKVTINAKNETIENILNTLFKDTQIVYKINNKQVALSRKDFAQLPAEASSASPTQEKRLISGVVMDESGETLPGATILVKENNRGGITDANGYFSLMISPEERTLIISFVGMKTEEVVIGNRTIFNVTLQSEADLLDEVIVTGYQTISKERATGSFAVITPKTLSEKLQTNVLSRLEGQVAGLVQSKNGTVIRGISTLNADRNPLIVVDGMPYEGNVESINPAIISNVTILKDAAAASIYGARAANGVIVISTKIGSQDGKTRVNYDGSIRFTPKPDFDYLNLMSTKELIDLQVSDREHIFPTSDMRYAVNPVNDLLVKHKDKLISDAQLASELDKLRALDNRQQIDDFYLRTGIMHQHNLAISGGNSKHNYMASINYMGNYDNARYSGVERLGFTLRDNMKFFDWLSADLGVAGNFTTSKGDTGMGNFLSFYTNSPSYYMLKDEKGNPLPILRSKSDYELERLRSIGLKDESYSPITNREEETYRNKDDYYRVQLGLNFKLMEGLNIDVRYQSENSSFKNRMLFGKESYTVRSMVNNAAQYNETTQELKLNVPEGAQLNETRGDSHSYTFRTQLNFMKEMGKHYITALAGAERRATKSASTQIYYMGFEEYSLAYRSINAVDMLQITGTQSLSNAFQWYNSASNRVGYDENRYVSFYANASYTYDYRYDLTGSIRIDQSNLFGTDPKYQYRPLWSLGASWHLAQEAFMKDIDWLNKLTLRATYGIGGNVPRGAGYFLTFNPAAESEWVGDFAATIKNPANPSLRWEKTATTNFGIDVAVLKNRLGVSIDLYNKYTNDLLAKKDTDPTLGWGGGDGTGNLMTNYGSMYNRGVEITINAQPVAGRSFQWFTDATFSYNKNKLLNIKDTKITAFDYTTSGASVEGRPMGAVFSSQFAGLDATGKPLYYDKEGEKGENVTSIEALRYHGTNTPVYTASLNNMLSYKNINLSFMFVYYGGHVMRGVAAPYMSSAPTVNIGREILNVWRKPGDEKIETTTPAFTGSQILTETRQWWTAADRHVMKADYIKLRDLSLSYSFDKQWTRQIGMESLKFILQVQNLWTWQANKQKLDPEATVAGSRTLPTPITWTVGASINF
ncbi:MAG: SusC/RagA family TonB-linked outer membrane protein [Bacteroidia bacterium]|nr:SusC/RagA family TonB-linked outer membrane protein [Bacteroidia bacterium]